MVESCTEIRRDLEQPNVISEAGRPLVGNGY